MLELFICILVMVAVALFTWGVREVSAHLFSFLADTSKEFDEQSKVVLALHRVNGCSHYTLNYIKAVISILSSAWVLWLALLLR